MKSSLKQIKRVGLACVALGAIAFSQQSLAAGTPAGTQIDNTATVNYQVSGVAQAAINSNTAQFLVDNKINLTVTRLDVSPGITVSPNGLNYVTTFKLTNIGNKVQGYELNGSVAGIGDANTSGAANPFGGAADSFDMLNTRTYVSSAACGPATTTPTYDAVNDTARFVDALNAESCVYVFVLADANTVALGATNGAVSVVRLTALTKVANTNAATPVNNSNAVADDAMTEDVVFADPLPARDAAEFADSVYVVSSATLAVAKSSSVISDPINSTNPKAIPGAVMEYAIRLTNSGGTNATGVIITDTLPTNGITYTTASYNSGNSDVSITVGGGPATFCTAEAGSDVNVDGCFRTAGGVLTVGAPALTQVSTGGNATEVVVRFRMTINLTP
jgi:uncharacterized repeat protein (TIGR01451 family)